MKTFLFLCVSVWGGGGGAGWFSYPLIFNQLANRDLITNIWCSSFLSAPTINSDGIYIFTVLILNMLLKTKFFVIESL